MENIKQETKKSVSLNVGQAISSRILIAEDDKTIRDKVSGFLIFMGFEVSLADNGVEAQCTDCGGQSRVFRR